MTAEEIIDGLYGLPVEEFTTTRDEAVRKLRKEGRREAAEQVKALRKPTSAAAAVNKLVRGYRAEVESFLEAAVRLRDAQVAGTGDAASAAQEERVLLERLVDLGGDAVRGALRAAAVDDDAARDLLAARLVREPEPRGFGTMLAHAKPATRKRMAAKGRATVRPDQAAARAKLGEAKKLLAAAAAEEREARQRWTQSQRELERALTTVERAQQRVDQLRAR